MDYMKESDQVSITQIATAYIFCLFVVGLSVLNLFLHPNSLSIVSGSIIAAIAAIAGVVYCTRKIGTWIKV